MNSVYSPISAKHISVPRNQQGQIAVIILLITVVILTVGLSIAARTTREIANSTQQSESTRVFNAAETGVEFALSQPFGSSPQSIGQGSIGENTAVEYDVLSGTQEVTLTLKQGQSAVVKLSAAATNEQVQIDWGTTDGPACQALLVGLYFNTQARFQGFKPSDCSDTPNDFLRVSPDSADINYRSRITLQTLSSTGNFNIGASDTLLRIKPVYNDTTIVIRGTNISESFYEVIRSEASNTVGEERRVVEVVRTLPSAPSFMDYSLYTRGSLAK